MLGVLLPGLLLLVCCVTAPHTEGEHSSCVPSAYLTRTQIFVSLYEDVITTSRDWDNEQEPVSPAQVALMY